MLADQTRPVETLCERHFEPSEYELTDLEPSCAACLRRREDPSRLSNAMFGSDLGARLLELSLALEAHRPFVQPIGIHLPIWTERRLACSSQRFGYINLRLRPGKGL